MNVLSLFDGMSCGQIALNRCGIKYDNYFASEIDKPAIAVTMANYPNTTQLGDIRKVSYTSDGLCVQRENGTWLDLPNSKIDLIIGGSPCQDISNLGSRKGLNGDKSSLFYEFFRLVDIIKPTHFFLENVKGNKAASLEITKLLGRKPIQINSALVSAQNRNRKYWTNIRVFDIPKDQKIYLTDIIENNVHEKYFLSERQKKWLYGESGKKSQEKRYTAINPRKSLCLTKRYPKSWNGTIITINDRERWLTPTECEKLQGVPIGYTSNVSDTHRYEMLGNGWNIDTICHFFNNLK